MRERQMLKLVAEGKKNREIAALLNLSAKTVEKHRANLMRKMGFGNASELVAYALDNGLV
jgi:DNA-binding NarL/FixJ family response regulator